MPQPCAAEERRLDSVHGVIIGVREDHPKDVA
jgi:hypothetical protein